MVRSCSVAVRRGGEFLRGFVVVAALAGVASCAAPGHGVQDNPVYRKFTWFSYVKGEDLQAACESGVPDRYRFVYNGNYVEQVRTYDLEPSPTPGQARMTARVSERANLTEVMVGEPADLLNPWRPKSAVVDLPAAEVERLKRALLADGFMTRPPPSRAITSIEFYWAVSACIDGHFRLNAYVWPSREFEQASFPKMLFAWDMTEVKVNPPRRADVFDVYGTSMESDSKVINLFRLRFDDKS